VPGHGRVRSLQQRVSGDGIKALSAQGSGDD